MKLNRLSLVAVSVLTATSLFAQVPDNYTVAPWKNFSASAITYSFDDGTPNQVPVAVPLLEKYNFRGSFNLITNWIGDWTPWKKISENGHEIASHTVSHPNLGQKDLATQEKELKDSKEIIEKNIGKECITMVYPYCALSNKELASKYYISARSCPGIVDLQTPKNMFDISSRGVGTESPYNSAQSFNEWVDKAYEQQGWLTFLIHGIDNDNGYSPIKSVDFDSHLKYVSENPDKFWVGTFAQVSKYIYERNSLKISEKVKKSKICLSVSCTASSPLTIFDEPVTVSRSLPVSWQNAAVIFNGKTVPSKVDGRKIIFDVIPGYNYEIVRK